MGGGGGLTQEQGALKGIGSHSSDSKDVRLRYPIRKGTAGGRDSKGPQSRTKKFPPGRVYGSDKWKKRWHGVDSPGRRRPKVLHAEFLIKGTRKAGGVRTRVGFRCSVRKRARVDEKEKSL